MTNTTPRTGSLPSTPLRPHRGRRAFLIGVSAVAVLGGTLTVLGQVDRSEVTTTDAVPGVREIFIDVPVGLVTVLGGQGSDVAIVTTRRGSLLGTPVAGHRLDAGVLRISADCPGPGISCEVEERITVPGGVAVHVQTSASRIEAVDLDTPRFEAETSAGSVTASFTRPPQDIRIDTSAGNVEVRVPDTAYSVAASTSAGTVSVGIVQDPSAPRSMRLDTSSGSITVLRR